MKKSIFLFFAAILCSMSINAAVPSKLYLDASGWGYTDARYAAYFMPQNSFVDMTKATGEVSVFEVAVPANQTQVIFVRMNGSKPANDWDNKWNQTGDLEIPTDGKNKFKPSGWDNATTTWSTYTYTPPKLYIAGDFVTPNWSPAATANKMDYADGVYSKSYNNVAASAHQFKITNGTWDNAIGYNKNTCSGTNCDVKDNGGNIQFTPLAEGTVTITYTLADGKVHITCPEPPAAEYSITYPATQTNYTLVAGPAKAQTSAEVSFTATPAEGYVLNVTYNGNVITGENNVYTFMMPASDVTIAITAVAATTLYYVDHNNWGNVNAYMWDNNGNNGWPGAAMTSVGTVGDNAYSYYSISFAQGAYTSIIFNNGSGSQTGDLTINTAKPYFYDGAWYTWDELLAKLAAPVVTYDYYITGTLAGGWDPKQQGLEKDGELYKATFTELNAGEYEFKITAGDWEHQWNYSNLGAAYEEVSEGVNEEGNPNGNIKIVTEEAKNITVIFDATAGKITLEGLTEKVVVISYVLMGVGSDWTTGIALTKNETAEYEEYVLLGQEIAEGDAVKVVTLTNGEATAWCGDVDEYSVAHTFDDNGNIVLAPGKYDFYFKVNDDIIYIGGEAYPVEPEYNVVEDEITNFVFDLEAWPMVCMGGPSTTYQVEVYLVLTEDADGTLDYENSSVSINGQDVTLIEGTLSNLDVYAPSADAVLRVQMGEEYYELHLAMSAAAPEPIEVVVENATVTLSEYEVSETESAYELVMIANWTYEKDGLTYEVECLLPTFDPTNESGNYAANFYVRGAGAASGMAEGANVLVTVENQTLKLTGEISAYNGNVYNVTISGTLPADEPEVPTALDNVDTAVAPAKVINNGQLIIIRNGVQYNAQGAVVK